MSYTANKNTSRNEILLSRKIHKNHGKRTKKKYHLKHGQRKYTINVRHLDRTIEKKLHMDTRKCCIENLHIDH